MKACYRFRACFYSEAPVPRLLAEGFGSSRRIAAGRAAERLVQEHGHGAKGILDFKVRLLVGAGGAS